MRKDIKWLYSGTCIPHFALTHGYDGRCSTSSQAGFSWGHKLPAKLQAAAGLAAEVERDQLLQQKQQHQQPQALHEAPLLNQSAVTSSSQLRHTGAFARLPMVPVSTEIIESALKRAGRIAANKKLKNEALKARSRAAKQMDTLTKEVAVPLGTYMKGFPSVQRLHPFEQAMLELTWGTQTYEKVLTKVDSLRKSILEVGKGYAGRANKATTKAEATAICEEGFASVEKLYLKSGACVDELKLVAQKLRRLPVVDPALPVVALVGAPNVGKSSLVNVLSSGVPEVCDYPFTTRSIKMGHFYVNGQRHQVTDTPGLLKRPLSERNAMERLTLACLNHLPSSILFVLDLTAQCGTSVEDQLAIRQSLRESFPDKLWLDIISASDLLTAHLKAADALIQQSHQSQASLGPLAASNLNEPSAAAASTLWQSNAGIAEEQQQPVMIQDTSDKASESHSGASNAHDDSSSGASSQEEATHQLGGSVPGSSVAAALAEEQDVWGGVMDSQDAMTAAVQAAALLPDAVRISSVTKHGIQELQLTVMHLLSSETEKAADPPI
ncbi:TPA: hypothetical protein ACH3X2_014202 [Trebouxia sp. C0005]